MALQNEIQTTKNRNALNINTIYFRIGEKMPNFGVFGEIARKMGQNTPIKQNISDASLADLMNIKISTVSRKPQTISGTPAAVFVISQEDIRRSSANSIPELLRMAPGLFVARIDSNKWSITSRGDSGRFADDMLVMVDGRTVSSPLFAGTFWETLDLPLEDIDRIEVIRGASGTIWGTNAGNGVVHIITKNARMTQGSLASGGGGSEERGFATARHGFSIGEDFHMRIFAKGFARDNSFSPLGAYDGWRMGTVGFRADWDINPVNVLTFQGQYHSGKAGQETFFVNPATPYLPAIHRIEDANLSGGHALMRWQHNTGERSNMALQAYYDHNHRNELSFHESRHTADVDFQHRFPFKMLLPLDFVWGTGYRWTSDQMGLGTPIAFDPLQRVIQTANVYGQTDIPLIEDRLNLTAGIKFVDNTYVRNQFLPTFRLLWTPTEKQSIWASAIRSLRIPSRYEREATDYHRDGAEFFRRVANPLIPAETLWAFEAGYRHQLHSALSMDVAAFFNDYNNSEAEVEFKGTGISNISNTHIFASSKSQIYGFEVFGTWQVMDRFRLMPGYSFMRIHTQAPAGFEIEAGEDPKHQVILRAQYDVTRQVEADAFFRYVDKLPGLEIGNYKALDLRLAWRPVSRLEFSVIGQNLLQAHHFEYMPEVIQTMPVQMQRGVFGRFTLRF